jgi:two-component system nitrate/nitrite response regulator NarP
MTSVLLADDHPFILEGLKAILRDSGVEIVGTVASGDETLEALPKLRPDILIMDVSMPGRTGVDVLRMLRSRGDQRQVVLLTASLDDDGLREVIDLRVNGIVLKESAHTHLLDCLASVRRGGRWIEQTLLQRALTLATNGNHASLLGQLSPRERVIVELVALGRRNREIASELGISEGTVKIHLHRIFNRLGVGSRTELALVARKSSG